MRRLPRLRPQIRETLYLRPIGNLSKSSSIPLSFNLRPFPSHPFPHDVGFLSLPLSHTQTLSLPIKQLHPRSRSPTPRPARSPPVPAAHGCAPTPGAASRTSPSAVVGRLLMMAMRRWDWCCPVDRRSPSLIRSCRIWSLAVAVAGLAAFLAGGCWEGLRPPHSR